MRPGYDDQARAAYAKVCGASPEQWQVVRRIQADVWYDFYDLATGLYGQCRMNADGTWHQAPRGKGPTILQYSKRAPNSVDKLCR